MVGENPTNPVLDTPKKIALAKWASAVLRGMRSAVGLSNQVRSTRGGIRWDLDLAEGIDLPIYLPGAFEPRLIRAYGRLIRPGACVVDIGANIGAHTLHFARLVGGRGKVVAYEPTGYAYRKLVANNSEAARTRSQTSGLLQRKVFCGVLFDGTKKLYRLACRALERDRARAQRTVAIRR